jgi:dTDP-4-amino-4,6-dideoxygalactose transaminase
MPKKREIPFGRPIIGEEEKKAVLEILNGPILVHGPKAEEFEADFCSYTGAAYAVSVSSCTAAMHLAYFDLEIGPGDEVIVSAQTHTATAHAVELTGARPVFVDSEKKTGNIDIEQIEAHITGHTHAIAIVHYLGMPVDMDRINAIGRKHSLFILEDCALAMGTRFRTVHAGCYGNVGCFSFYPVKHMTTAEGGMITTNDQKLADRIRRKRAFGVDRHAGERKIPGVYDVNMLGFNYRMNELEAALGVEQLKRVDGFLKRREENELALRSELSLIDELICFESSHGPFKSSYYCFSIILKESLASKRIEFVSSLQQKGVGTSVYYPRPVPHMTYYRQKYGYDDSSFPVAAMISYCSVALPVGPHLDTEDMKYITASIKDAIMEVK